MIADIEPEAAIRGDRALVAYGPWSDYRTSYGTPILTFPYDSNFTQAPILSLNSIRRGEYIFQIDSKLIILNK